MPINYREKTNQFHESTKSETIKHNVDQERYILDKQINFKNPADIPKMIIQKSSDFQV